MTWVIILIVFIGLIFLAGLGVGLYFLFRQKESNNKCADTIPVLNLVAIRGLVSKDQIRFDWMYDNPGLKDKLGADFPVIIELSSDNFSTVSKTIPCSARGLQGCILQLAGSGFVISNNYDARIRIKGDCGYGNPSNVEHCYFKSEN